MNRPIRPGADRDTGSFDTTRLGMVASIIFMAGGLYWTAAVGLLTVSALQASSTAILIGAVVLIVTVIGATFWSARGRRSASFPLLHSNVSNSRSMSTYDSVTGLPTHRLFTSLLNQALQRAHANGRQVAILMIELDHFTLANELQGQMNCNLVYRVQAARVKSALQTVDCVARLAERTFVVLLDQVATQDDVVAIAKKMQSTVSLPLTVNGQDIFLTSRIGISLSTRDEAEATALLESAIQAVAAARAEGYVIYGLHGAVVSPQADSTATIAANLPVSLHQGSLPK